MNKANVFSLKPRPREIENLEMTDPETGIKVEMAFRELRSIDLVNIEAQILHYVGRYIEGTGPLDAAGNVRRDSAMYTPPVPLPPLEGEPILVTESGVRVIATLEFMQTEYGGNPDSYYSFTEIAAMMAGSPVFARKLNQTFQRMMSSAMEAGGTLPGENPTKTQEPASTDTQSKNSANTLNFSEESSPCGTQSMLDLVSSVENCVEVKTQE